MTATHLFAFTPTILLDLCISRLERGSRNHRRQKRRCVAAGVERRGSPITADAPEPCFAGAVDPFLGQLISPHGYARSCLLLDFRGPVQDD